MNQAYLDKLDGTIAEEFWAEHAGTWQAEKARIMEQLSRHQQADGGYLEAGSQILDVVGRAGELYQSRDSAGRRELLGSILADCTLMEGKVTPVYRPPFDTLARMAAEKEPLPTQTGRRRKSSRIDVWGG